MDAQADLSCRWAHMSVGTFSHDMAYLIPDNVIGKSINMFIVTGCNIDKQNRDYLSFLDQWIVT